MIRKEKIQADRVRLRVDDEEFDAIPRKDGAFEVAEVVLSNLCTHGDVVRADETGRVTSVLKSRYMTKATFCTSESEARALIKESPRWRAARVVAGTIVLASVRRPQTLPRCMYDANDEEAFSRKGRMRCPRKDSWYVLKLPFSCLVAMSPLDAVRTERYAMRRFQNDRRRVDKTRRGNLWPLWIVKEMLAETLTEESALAVEYRDG